MFAFAPTLITGVRDPYFSNVSSLLHFDGTNGSTTFTDQKGKTWTPDGNAQISTSQFKFGGASGFFDGSGDYLSTSNNSDFYFGNGAFTIEAWVRLTSLPSSGNYRFICCRDNIGVTRGWRFLVDGDAGGKLTFADTSSSTDYVVADTSVFPLNTWTHVAAASDGTTLKLFSGGTQVASTSVSGVTFNDAAVGTLIATSRQLGIFTSINHLWNGQIDDFRVTKGICRYTGNFTPTPSPFPNS